MTFRHGNRVRRNASEEIVARLSDRQLADLWNSANSRILRWRQCLLV
jgi:hypothetical protein